MAPGDLLPNLASQVFLPALSFNQHKTDVTLGASSLKLSESLMFDDIDLPGEPVEYHSAQLVRDEFLMNLQKFANSIQRTMQQLEGRLRGGTEPATRDDRHMLLRHRACHDEMQKGMTPSLSSGNFAFRKI